MRKGIVLIQHLIISSITLLILLGIVFSFFYFVPDILIKPQKYFNISLSLNDFQFLVLHISLIVVSVLVSYIIYLLLSSKTRAELIALNKTRVLKASLERFEKLYDEAPVPYITINEAGEIYKPNKAALRFFGVVLKEIEGKNIFYYQPKEDSEKIEKLIRYYKSGLSIDREEVRLITKNGAIKWVLLSVFGLKNFGVSKRTGLVSIFDITEQKKLDQAKTEFVSLASHQLRSPAATIKWYMDMLLSDNFGELSPKQKDYLARIHQVNEDMIDLIETLLNVSKIEIGSIKAESKPTNAIELADSVLAELVHQIEEKNINIEKQYNNNLKNIESDPKLLRIIIQNLISNAVKYTPNEGKITVIFKESLRDKSIIISDTGIGIPKDQQNKIFGKLFRASNAPSIVGGQGTGLGLYMVKSITEAMGGNISFVSEENNGSTFTLKF